MTATLQIKFEFNSIEDRLLLRISEKQSHTCNEYSFWLTRRFVNVFLRAIDKLIENELAGNMQVSPESKAAMKKFQREAALAKADFSKSYDAGEENCTRAGEPPLLVSTLKVKKRSNGRYVLSLLNSDNKGMHLTAGVDLIFSLQKMLVDSAKRADWGQPLCHTTGVVKTIEPAGLIS